MKGLEKGTNYYYRGFVIQKVAPSTYEVYGPKKTDESGKITREQVGLIESLAGARDIVVNELTMPVNSFIEECPE